MPKTTYWVMYNEGTRDGKPLHKGTDRVSRDTQHYGTADLDTAKKTVLEFRDHASRGTHFLNARQWPNLVLNSAWIEVETRDRLEF